MSLTSTQILLEKLDEINKTNITPKHENKVYKLLQPYRYLLAFYLSKPNSIGGELYIILKNGKAVLDFKYSYFEENKLYVYLLEIQVCFLKL